MPSLEGVREFRANAFFLSNQEVCNSPEENKQEKNSFALALAILLWKTSPHTHRDIR